MALCPPIIVAAVSTRFTAVIDAIPIHSHLWDCLCMRARGISGNGSLDQSSSGKGIVAQGRSHTARSQCSRKHIVRCRGTIATNEGEEGREGRVVVVVLVDEKKELKLRYPEGIGAIKVLAVESSRIIFSFPTLLHVTIADVNHSSQ